MVAKTGGRGGGGRAASRAAAREDGEREKKKKPLPPKKKQKKAEAPAAPASYDWSTVHPSIIFSTGEPATPPETWRAPKNTLGHEGLFSFC